MDYKVTKGADMGLHLIFEGYEIWQMDDGHYVIGQKGNKKTKLTGTSSRLLSVLKFLIMKKEWDKK
jgi:hypothetical protein